MNPVAGPGALIQPYALARVVQSGVTGLHPLDQRISGKGQSAMHADQKKHINRRQDIIAGVLLCQSWHGNAGINKG
jgi:hypothetical protein